jgi:hypothetical protein
LQLHPPVEAVILFCLSLLPSLSFMFSLVFEQPVHEQTSGEHTSNLLRQSQ